MPDPGLAVLAVFRRARCFHRVAVAGPPVSDFSIWSAIAVGPVFFKELFQPGAAPSAAGSSPKTLAELSGTLRPMQPDPVPHLAEADMKTEAEFVVRVHLAADLSICPTFGELKETARRVCRRARGGKHPLYAEPAPEFAGGGLR